MKRVARPPWEHTPMQRLIRRVVDRGQAAVDVFREREGDLSLRYILCTEPDAWLRVLRGELASISL